MDVYELGTLDANFLRYGLHSVLQKCPLVANREQWNVARINEKLSTPANRLQGLAVLEAFLPQCSDDIFGENALSWMQHCLHALEAHAGGGSVPLAFHVLETLLQMSSHFPELTKAISSSVISKALAKIVSNLDGDSVPALQCLHVIMTHYGGACGPSKALLEGALLASVGSPCRAARAAGCWALLAAVGGAGPQRTNHRQQWAAMHLQLCNTLHHLLARLLAQYRVLHSWTEDDDNHLPLPEVREDNPVVSVQNMTKQLCGVSEFLQSMLRGMFPAVKSVSVGEVMAVVCRGLAVNCFSVPKKDAGELVIVATCLPDIHIAMLGLLEALIACCGRNLIPFGGVICDLALQELKWTAVESPQYASERPFGLVRLAACRMLSAWLEVSKAASLVEIHAEQLVAALLPDVHSARPGITLSAVSSGKMKKGGPKGGHLVDGSGMVPQRSKLHDCTANSEVCAMALETLHHIVYSGATFVPAKLHKILQEVVVSLVLEVQRSTCPEEMPVPYVVSGCRLGLYRLLEALASRPHGKLAPPSHFALAAFSRGQADVDRKVSSFCTAALGHMEKVLHPACVTMQFPRVAPPKVAELGALVEVPSSLPGQERTLVEDLALPLGKELDSQSANGSEVEAVEIAMVSDTEGDVEVVAIEAVSDDTDDGSSHVVATKTPEEARQLDHYPSSPASSAVELMDITGSNLSEDEVTIVDESHKGNTRRKVGNGNKQKKRGRTTKKDLLLEEEPSCAADNSGDIQSNLIGKSHSESFREHEDDSGHCWTAEEAALVTDLVKNFELGEQDASAEENDSMDGTENEDDASKISSDTLILKAEKEARGSQFLRELKGSVGKDAGMEKVRKREASPSPVSMGPQDKRQKTEVTSKWTENEDIEVIDLEEASELVTSVAIDRSNPDNTAVEPKDQNEISIIKETEQVETSSERTSTKGSSEIQVEGDEKCSSQVEVAEEYSGQMASREGKCTEEEIKSMRTCPAQAETNKSFMQDREVDEAGGGSMETCTVQLEADVGHSELVKGQDGGERENDQGQSCPREVESCGENHEEPSKQEVEGAGKVSDTVQVFPAREQMCEENPRLNGHEELELRPGQGTCTIYMENENVPPQNENNCASETPLKCKKTHPVIPSGQENDSAGKVLQNVEDGISDDKS